MLSINKNLLEMNLAKATNYTDTKDENASCVFISGEDDRLSFEATNYIEAIRIKEVPCSMKETLPRIAVDGKKLLSVIKSMKNDDVLLSLSDENLIVKQDRSRFSIQTQATNSIEKIAFPKGETEIPLNAQLLNGFEHIAHAIDPNNSQFQMAGALIETTEDTIAIIGTDGKRLAGVKYGHKTPQEHSIIIPKAAIASMTKLFRQIDIECYTSEISFTVMTETIDYTTKVINGKYPQWRRIVPKDIQQQVVIDTDTLRTLVQQAIAISTEGTLSIMDGELTIVATGEKNESMSTAMEFDDSINGIEFSVNLKYLLDFLTATESKRIDLYYTDTNLPFMLKDEEMIEVIMPIANLNVTTESSERAA